MTCCPSLAVEGQTHSRLTPGSWRPVGLPCVGPADRSTAMSLMNEDVFCGAVAGGTTGVPCTASAGGSVGSPAGGTVGGGGVSCPHALDSIPDQPGHEDGQGGASANPFHYV